MLGRFEIDRGYLKCYLGKSKPTMRSVAKVFLILSLLLGCFIILLCEMLPDNNSADNYARLISFFLLILCAIYTLISRILSGLDERSGYIIAGEIQGNISASFPELLKHATNIRLENLAYDIVCIEKKRGNDHLVQISLDEEDAKHRFRQLFNAAKEVGILSKDEKYDKYFATVDKSLS